MTQISINPLNEKKSINSIESTLTKVWNGLKIASFKGVNATSLAVRTTYHAFNSSAQNFLIKSSEVGNNLIQNKYIYLTGVPKEVLQTTIKNLGFIAFGFTAHEVLSKPIGLYLDRLELTSTVPQLPKFLKNFSITSAFLEGSLPADKNNFSRLLINRPLFFGTLLFGLTQEGLLKKVPEKILKKIAPLHASEVNSRMAKIARVSLTAAIYSLASTLAFTDSSYVSHSNLYSVSVDNLIWNFGVGSLCGCIQEFTGNPVYSMATLLGFNLSFSMQFNSLIPLFPHYREQKI